MVTGIIGLGIVISGAFGDPGAPIQNEEPKKPISTTPTPANPIDPADNAATDTAARACLNIASLSPEVAAVIAIIADPKAIVDGDGIPTLDIGQILILRNTTDLSPEQRECIVTSLIDLLDHNDPNVQYAAALILYELSMLSRSDSWIGVIAGQSHRLMEGYLKPRGSALVGDITKRIQDVLSCLAMPVANEAAESGAATHTPVGKVVKYFIKTRSPLASEVVSGFSDLAYSALVPEVPDAVRDFAFEYTVRQLSGNIDNRVSATVSALVIFGHVPRYQAKVLGHLTAIAQDDDAYIVPPEDGLEGLAKIAYESNDPVLRDAVAVYLASLIKVIVSSGRGFEVELPGKIDLLYTALICLSMIYQHKDERPQTAEVKKALVSALRMVEKAALEVRAKSAAGQPGPADAILVETEELLRRI